MYTKTRVLGTKFFSVKSRKKFLKSPQRINWYSMLRSRATMPSVLIAQPFARPVLKPTSHTNGTPNGVLLWTIQDIFQMFWIAVLLFLLVLSTTLVPTICKPNLQISYYKIWTFYETIQKVEILSTFYENFFNHKFSRNFSNFYKIFQ